MTLKRKDFCVLSDKLNDLHTSAKSCQSILKTLYNGKKIPLIPPILINNKVTSNLKEKANHFNPFCPSKFTPVSNKSTLPLVTTAATNASLSSVSLNDQDILKTVHSINTNKALGYDDISTRLLKIFHSSIVRNVCRSGLFLITVKSQMLYLYIKKGDRQLLQNYWPVSLLPIFGKIFQRINFNLIF